MRFRGLLCLRILLLFSTMCGIESTAPRRKRALTFPTGTHFILTTAIIKPIQLNVPKNWNLDCDFDMDWPVPEGILRPQPPPMPTTSKPMPMPPRRSAWIADRRPIAWPQRHRRHRRQLYANVELALDSQGFPGNLCILRAICEAKSVLSPPGVSLVEDLLRVIFRYPSSGGIPDHDDYDLAYSETKSECDEAYPCPFSIVDLLLSHESPVYPM